MSNALTKRIFRHRSKLLQENVHLDFNLYRLEVKLNLLFEETGLKSVISKKKVGEFNKFDIDVVCAMLKARLERIKAIQYTIGYMAFMFASLVSIVVVLWNSNVYSIFATTPVDSA